MLVGGAVDIVVGDELAVDVGLAVAVNVSLGVTVAVAVAVNVSDAVAVALTVMVDVGNGVFVPVAVRVGVAVNVLVMTAGTIGDSGDGWVGVIGRGEDVELEVGVETARSTELDDATAGFVVEATTTVRKTIATIPNWGNRYKGDTRTRQRRPLTQTLPNRPNPDGLPPIRSDPSQPFQPRLIIVPTNLGSNRLRQLTRFIGRGIVCLRLVDARIRD